MKIGPYEVLNELGRGGMGVVYRVRAPDGREAALKLLLRVDPETFAHFERERRLLASLGERDGFVGLLDAGVSAEGAWLVMPFVPGGTLRKRLEAGPLPVEETVRLGLALARTLGAAHARGIVHRDVKPENVLFAGDGRPLLADLGLAKHFDPLAKGASQSVSLTRHGTTKGTAGYMALEQLEDPGSVGPPADVFSLGAVLYECLAGRPPFAGGSVLEVLTRLSSGIVAPIGRAEVPPWLEEIVVRSLALEPRVRFAGGSALARAIQSRGGGKVPAPRRGLAGPLALGASLGGLGLAVALGLGHRTPAPAGRRAAAPSAPPRPQRLRAEELVVRAEEKFRGGDLAGAIDETTKAIALDPGLALAWATRGAARSNTGDRDGGLADLTKAVELDPTFSLAWLNRGLTRGHKGDLEGAIDDYTRTIELDPTNVMAWVNRAVARGKKGDRDGEIADYTRAIELDPTLASAWMHRGVARGWKGDADGEIDDDTRAIELAPELAEAWMNRGIARGRKGDLDRGAVDLTKAIELDPGLVRAWEARGTARSHGGDLDGAIADVTRAIELDPGHARAWSVRGAVRAMKGDFEGAIADLSRAIELDPDGPGAADARRYLAEAKKSVR